MKKILLICASIGAILLGSCSSEEPILTNENDGNVVFTATLPHQLTMSRSSYDDGLTATNLYYAVYDTDGDNIVGLNGTSTFTDRQATVSLSLVTGKTYTVVFWAAAPEAPYAFDVSTGTVTVTTAGNANDIKRDAFFAYEKFTVTGAINKTVELKRPFAQINIGTSDLEAFSTAGGNISRSGITVTAPNKLNLLDGTVSGEAEYRLLPAAFLAESESFPVATTPPQRWLTTAFVLTGDTKATVDIKWTSDNTTTGRNAVDFTFVPIQRNFRTNIYGTLLTNPAEYDLVINQEFETPDFNEGDRIADDLYFNKTTGTYGVYSAEALKTLMDEYPLKGGESVCLYADIDMGGETMPVIKSWNPENPNTFDGMGHTISNMKLDGDNKHLIEIWVGTVKNITIDGMTGDNIKKRFSGLVGNLYGNVENVHIKNVSLTTKDGRIGAIIGIHNSGGMKNCSIENVDITGGWSVGGMIGVINETPTGRIYENLTVKNVRVTNTHLFWGVYNEMVGVIVGNINIAGVEFKNCVIEDCDTELPIYHTYIDYIWNGSTIVADISDE